MTPQAPSEWNQGSKWQHLAEFEGDITGSVDPAEEDPHKSAACMLSNYWFGNHSYRKTWDLYHKKIDGDYNSNKLEMTKEASSAIFICCLIFPPIKPVMISR